MRRRVRGREGEPGSVEHVGTQPSSEPEAAPAQPLEFGSHPARGSFAVEVLDVR